MTGESLATFALDLLDANCFDYAMQTGHPVDVMRIARGAVAAIGERNVREWAAKNDITVLDRDGNPYPWSSE